MGGGTKEGKWERSADQKTKGYPPISTNSPRHKERSINMNRCQPIKATAEQVFLKRPTWGSPQFGQYAIKVRKGRN